jgi:hypothetical protein
LVYRFGYGIINDYEGYAAEEELPRAVYRADTQSGTLSKVGDHLVRPS